MSPSTLNLVVVLSPHNNAMVSFHYAAWAVTTMVHWRRRSSCISATHSCSPSLAPYCPVFLPFLLSSCPFLPFVLFCLSRHWVCPFIPLSFSCTVARALDVFFSSFVPSLAPLLHRSRSCPCLCFLRPVPFFS